MAAKRPPKKPTEDAPDTTPVRDNARWSSSEFWFKEPIGSATIHQKITDYGQRLQALYSTAHARDRVHERLYEGAELRKSRGALMALQAHGFKLARLNVSKSIINTLVSRLAKDRPMPSFIPNDTAWTLKRKSRQYRKFILGEMNVTKFEPLSKEALVDGAVIGNGFTVIDDTGDGEKVFAERMLREELLYDPRECKYGRPQNAIRVHRIARDHLAELYPAFARQIFNAEGSRRRGTGDEIDDDTTKIGDLDAYVDVWRPYHLPTTEGTGRTAICISNATLAYEEWEFSRYPWATYRFQKPRRGVWSKGLIFELKDIQHRINCIVRDMQMNLQATGRGFFMQQEGNDLPIEMLTGIAPFSVKYKGTHAPQWNAPAPFNQAQLGALQFFIQLAHDISGVSQASATSKSALGPGASGVALDTQYDIDSERFGIEEGNYADYRIEAAQLYIDASKRVAKKRAERKDKKPSVYTSGWINRDAIQQLEHDAVSMKDDEYQLQIETTNYIPDTRAGKLSIVGQLAQSGMIPPWLAAALFDDPDLMRAARITLGAFYNAERKMDELYELDKEMPMPAPYNDLDLEKTMCTAYLNNAEAEGAPDEICQRFRDYLGFVLDAIAAKKKGEAMAMPPPAMAGPGGPADMPGAAPMLPPGAPMPQGAGGPPPVPQQPPMAA